MILPADDYILISVLNTKLRDLYPSLEELCEEEGLVCGDVVSRAEAAGYAYDGKTNSFKII